MSFTGNFLRRRRGAALRPGQPRGRPRRAAAVHPSARPRHRRQRPARGARDPAHLRRRHRRGPRPGRSRRRRRRRGARRRSRRTRRRQRAAIMERGRQPVTPVRPRAAPACGAEGATAPRAGMRRRRRRSTRWCGRSPPGSARRGGRNGCRGRDGRGDGRRGGGRLVVTVERGTVVGVGASVVRRHRDRRAAGRWSWSRRWSHRSTSMLISCGSMELALSSNPKR